MTLSSYNGNENLTVVEMVLSFDARPYLVRKGIPPLAAKEVSIHLAAPLTSGFGYRIWKATGYSQPCHDCR